MHASVDITEHHRCFSQLEFLLDTRFRASVLVRHVFSRIYCATLHTASAKRYASSQSFSHNLPKAYPA